MMLAVECTISRPIAARVAGVPYVTAAYWLSRGLMAEPLGLPHVVALAVAGRLRKQGIRFDSVRGPVGFVASKTAAELRRHFAAGRRFLLIGLDTGRCSLRDDAVTSKSRGGGQLCMIVDLAQLFDEIESALAVETEGANDED